MDHSIAETEKSIRRWLIFFIVGLILSGLTAFPLESELGWLCNNWADKNSALYHWIKKCHLAIRDTNSKYPFLAYGYDWLAFAHIVIATAFIGPLNDPIRNIWIIQWGRIACVMVIPLAFIAGEIRGIPIGWRLIDCSFGVAGIIPLTICYNKITLLEVLKSVVTT